MKGKMVVRDKVVSEERAERGKISAHVFVVARSATGIHAAACGEIYGADEVDEIVEE